MYYITLSLRKECTDFCFVLFAQVCIHALEELCECTSFFFLLLLCSVYSTMVLEDRTAPVTGTYSMVELAMKAS